jgi:transcriptional regulator SbtR-like protein
VAELRAAWQPVIAAAQEAGVLRNDFQVDDIRTMMCGLGAMMAAHARGAMPYDWARQLDLFLDGVRASPS